MGNNILIVDDAAFMRMMVKDILTKGVLLCRHWRKERGQKWRRM